MEDSLQDKTKRNNKIGGYPKILGNLIPKFFGVKYHCRYIAKCTIPMLLLHTFSMMGDYVVDSNKIKTTFDPNLSSWSKFSRRTKRK